MHTGLFKGRADMRGIMQERNKKKAGERAEKRQQKPGNNRRKFSHLPTGGRPIPPAPRVIKRRCRHVCNKCSASFVADSREAFCRNCGSNALTVTYN